MCSFAYAQARVPSTLVLCHITSIITSIIVVVVIYASIYLNGFPHINEQLENLIIMQAQYKRRCPGQKDMSERKKLGVSFKATSL